MNTISLKQKIIFDLEMLEKWGMLGIVWQFVEYLKAQVPTPKGNISQVFAFVGCISDADAAEMQQTIQAEFNHIEGDWT